MSPSISKNPGIAESGRFPHSAPSRPDAPHVGAARVHVDAASSEGDLTPIWASLGYDEINWTYTERGVQLLRSIGEFSPVGYHVRPHNLFVSGPGFGLPHWGSGNVYHENASGEPIYDFAIADATYDAIVEAGHHPLVELGFTPKDLVPDRAYVELELVDSPPLASAYEAWHWAYPPKDLTKWGALVAALAQHVVDRYGENEVSHWLWELWNEPDIFYWRGTHQEFCELYEVTARAVRSVLPDAQVGGPAVTGGADGPDFLRRFLAFTAAGSLPLDFVSFHTKGSAFRPWRTYGPLGASVQDSEKQSPSMAKMLYEVRRLLRVVAEFPAYRGLPAIVDECDAAVPAHWGIYDNPNFAFQNTEYYPVFQLKLMKKLLDLNALEQVAVAQATTWSFYFEGERYFEGTRALATAGGIEKPLLNGYRMLAKLGRQRISADSDAAWPVTALDDLAEANLPEEVDVMASRDDSGRVSMIVWRHSDDQYQSDATDTEVTVEFTGLEHASYRVHHWRIDRDHSNAHTVWASLGSPQRPNEQQLTTILGRQGLEKLDDGERLDVADGMATMTVRLPLPSASLLVLEPEGPR